MNAPKGPVLDIADVELRGPPPERAPKGETAEKYDIRRGGIANRIGARKLGYSLTVVAPGKTNCPFHSHHMEEEMFFIIGGTGELRYGEATYPLKPGDIVACPTGGPETAHQIINTGTIELRSSRSARSPRWKSATTPTRANSACTKNCRRTPPAGRSASVTSRGARTHATTGKANNPMAKARNEITIRFLAESNDVNFGGNVHGGTVMKWIDQTAYTCAASWSGTTA